MPMKINIYKKIPAMLNLSLFVMFILTGCAISYDETGIHIQEHKDSYYHYTNIDYASLIIFALIGIFAVLFSIGIIRRIIRRYRKDIWVKTTATILDDISVLEKEPRRAYRQMVVYPDLRVEYFVDGKKYEKYLNGSELFGCIDMVEIEYLKERPDIIRVYKDLHMEDKK